MCGGYFWLVAPVATGGTRSPESRGVVAILAGRWNGADRHGSIARDGRRPPTVG